MSGLGEVRKNGQIGVRWSVGRLILPYHYPIPTLTLAFRLCHAFPLYTPYLNLFLLFLFHYSLHFWREQFVSIVTVLSVPRILSYHPVAMSRPGIDFSLSATIGACF